VDARNQKWDSIERDIPMTDFDGAETCYVEALAGFDSGGAPRGIAAIYLR
jgi:hypothetical protein